MPARSRSQQRLFGMVHAYNKGEFHGPKGLRSRIAQLAKRVSDTDAAHFAGTSHAGLPEKRAQLYARPDQADELMRLLAPYATNGASFVRSSRRRSFLSRIVPGMLIGAAFGGLGYGALGAYLTARAGRPPHLSPDEFAGKMRDAALQMGLWGAGRGALAGGAVGAGLGVLDKIRGQ